MKLTQFLKAIVALLGAFFGSLVQATAEPPLSGQSDITTHEWLVAITAALVLAGAVWVTPNYVTKTNESGQTYMGPVTLLVIVILVVLLVLLLTGRL